MEDSIKYFNNKEFLKLIIKLKINYINYNLIK